MATKKQVPLNQGSVPVASSVMGKAAKKPAGKAPMPTVMQKGK
jgi:hypothetical protein